MNKIKWDELFKIRIANSSPEFQKHEVIKILLVMKLIHKYRKMKSWIRIYTEFQLENGLKPDVYFENVKSKEVIVFEIQKNFSKKWLKEKTEQYNNKVVPFFNTLDFIPIPLNDFPNDIEGIDEKLEEYI